MCTQILSGQVEPPIEFIQLYDQLATLQSNAPKSGSTEPVKASPPPDGSNSTSTPKAKKGVLGKLTRAFSSKA